jgi:HEAT repeat protein
MNQNNMKTETTQLLNSALEILENARLAEEYKQEVEKLTTENANLRQEVVNFKFICDTNEACINNQYELIKEISDERDHWKANHDNQVALKQTLSQRPDLKDRSVKMNELMDKLDIARRALLEAIMDSSRPNDATFKRWFDAYQVSLFTRY